MYLYAVDQQKKALAFKPFFFPMATIIYKFASLWELDRKKKNISIGFMKLRKPKRIFKSTLESKTFSGKD